MCIGIDFVVQSAEMFGLNKPSAFGQLLLVTATEWKRERESEKFRCLVFEWN